MLSVWRHGHSWACLRVDGRRLGGAHLLSGSFADKAGWPAPAHTLLDTCTLPRATTPLQEAIDAFELQLEVAHVREDAVGIARASASLQAAYDAVLGAAVGVRVAPGRTAQPAMRPARPSAFTPRGTSRPGGGKQPPWQELRRQSQPQPRRRQAKQKPQHQLHQDSSQGSLKRAWANPTSELLGLRAQVTPKY